MKKATILRELQERFSFGETKLDLSLLKLQPDAEEEIENIFYDMANSLKDSEMCVANNGLCLLIAYTQEQIQKKRQKNFIARRDLSKTAQAIGSMHTISQLIRTLYPKINLSQSEVISFL